MSSSGPATCGSRVAYEAGDVGVAGDRPVLGLVRDWPTTDGVAAAERMTAVLEKLIAAKPDEGKRRKLAMVRDILVELSAWVRGPRVSLPRS